MNKQAENWLVKAEGFFAKGDEFYGKAADAIISAQKADTTLSNREIGEWFGKGRDWPARVVAWATSDARVNQPTPWSGRDHADNRATAHAKRVLRESTPEQIESMLSSLPTAKVNVVAGIAEKVYNQKHPATAVRPPTGLGKGKSQGFLLEISGASQKLVEAIDRFIEIWDREAPNATEEELQVERDLIAPKLQSLRMTVEEVVV